MLVESQSCYTTDRQFQRSHMHVMKTMIPKSGLDEICNKVSVPLTLRYIRNSTNYKSHYIPLGLSLPPQVPLPKSPKPSRVRFPTRTGTHLSHPVFRMVVSHLMSLPSNTEGRRALGKTVAERGASAIFNHSHGSQRAQHYQNTHNTPLCCRHLWFAHHLTF